LSWSVLHKQWLARRVSVISMSKTASIFMEALEGTLPSSR
jgi:hypothetical protein